MGGLTQGPRPDITPPQIVAMVIAGIPILAQLLHAFGIYDLSPESQEALNNAVTWAGVFAGSLIGGDAVLRTGRNLRKGRVEAVLAEGGEDLEIVHDVLAEDEAAAVASIPSPVHPEESSGAAPDAPPDIVTGFEAPPPESPPVQAPRQPPYPNRRRKRK